MASPSHHVSVCHSSSINCSSVSQTTIQISLAMSPSALFSFMLFWGFSGYGEALKDCYLSDGVTTAVSQGDYDVLPCILVDGIDSMCCAVNRTSAADTCESNGLCLASDGTYWRDYCTDPAWGPNCVPVSTCRLETGVSLCFFEKQRRTPCLGGFMSCLHKLDGTD